MYNEFNYNYSPRTARALEIAMRARAQEKELARLNAEYKAGEAPRKGGFLKTLLTFLVSGVR